MIDQDVGRKKDGGYNARDVYQMMFRVYKNATAGELRPTTVYSAFSNGTLGDLVKRHRQLTYGQVADAAVSDLGRWYQEVGVEKPIVRTRGTVNKRDLTAKVEDLERQVHRLRVSYHGEAVPPPTPVKRSAPRPKKEPRTYRITQMGRVPQYVEVSPGPSPMSTPEVRAIEYIPPEDVTVVPLDPTDDILTATLTDIFGSGVSICRIETNVQRRRRKKKAPANPSNSQPSDSQSGSGLLGGGLLGGGLLGGCSGLRRL